MTSAAVTKELFDKAELVSSNDPGLDPSNLVYMDSDSECSEQFSYAMDIQEAAHCEVVKLGKEMDESSNDAIINPIHVSIKMEEELMIEDEPIEVNSDDDLIPEDQGTPHVEGGDVSLEGIKSELDSQEFTSSLNLEKESLNSSHAADQLDELNRNDEQFEIICDESTDAEAVSSQHTSLVDHAYSQIAKESFCDDIVRNILENGKSRVQLLSNFTETFAHFFDEDQQSQAYLYLQNMKDTLQRLLAAQNIIQVPMTETEPEATDADLLEEMIDIPETELEDEEPEKKEEAEELELEHKVPIEEIIESEEVQRLKLNIKNVEEFGKNLSDQASALAIQPLRSDENITTIKLNLMTLLKESKKKFRSLKSEIENEVNSGNNINEKAKKNLLVSESSELSSDTDSEGDQVKKRKRENPIKSGPQTPAIVSSTKEDYEVSGAEDSKSEVKRQSSSSECESGKRRDNDKYIKKLIDLSPLVNHKPDRSQKSSKVKRLSKKKKKETASDIDTLSTDDDATAENTSSSSDSERDTSDDEQQMLKKLNAEDRDDLLASSGGSSISDSSDLSDDSYLSDNDDKKTSKTKKIEPKKSKRTEAAVVKSVDSDDSDVENSSKKVQETNSKPESSNADETKSDNKAVEINHDISSDEANPSRKKIKRDSLEREVFSKNFLEIAGSVDETSTSATAAGRAPKIEKLSPQKAARPADPNGAIDFSLYDNRSEIKEIDVQKLIDKRNNDVAGPSTPHNRPVPVINDDDEDLIMISSESESESAVATETGTVSRLFKRKKLLTEDELQQETKRAQKEEEKRVKRLVKKNDTITQMMSQRMSEEDPTDEEVILDYDPKTNVTIKVHPKLVKNLKPHQKEGIKFMYDTCFGSISDDVETKSGCILAHCMGLGKTLQLITLIHTLIRYPEKLKTKRILVICPKSTIINWFEEFKKWLKDIDSKNMNIFFLEERVNTCVERILMLEKWYNSANPGVFLINYEAFRNLVLYNGPNQRSTNPMPPKDLLNLQERICKCLVDPGPDLVACDEGHVIKNQKNAISRAITKISTRRRVILTGTPVQNNLNEYYSMVDWIKPALLGTVKEFNNLYANPIKDGQHSDSTDKDIKRMKQRSLILNRKLSEFVQRKEATVLKDFLHKKYEYCIFVPLTKVQVELYENFLRLNPMEDGHKLLNDYTALRKIWTHPKVLQNAYERAHSGQLKLNESTRKQQRNGLDEVDFDFEDDLLDKDEGYTGVRSEWWRRYVSDQQLESLYSSNKIILLFEILSLCKERKEKVLVFSAFVAVLNVVEGFMKKIHNAKNCDSAHAFGYTQFEASWEEGKDYYRLDGSTKRDVRHQMIQNFNKQENTRMRCFLISAKAGGQGINLIGANRCIILDTSWNPSSDQQNIFRIYRLGQPKDCFVYRLIALGTMEEKVYSRSVTKQAMSGRVVDKLQIDRHYRVNELSELYTLTKTDETKRTQPQISKDSVLNYLLQNYPGQAFRYHIHDSLLENKPEQDLNEDDIKEAWAIYESELQGRPLMNGLNQPNNDLMRTDMGNYLAAMADTAPGLFNPIFSPGGYFSNDYFSNLMPFDISGALRNTLVPTSTNAGSTMASTSSTSMLRTQLNQLNPMYNVNSPMFNFQPPASSTQNAPPVAQKRRASNAKKQQSSSPSIAPTNNFQDLMTLQSRYNGNITSRPIDEIRPRKNSSANLSILPDIDPQISRIVPQNNTLLKAKNSQGSRITPPLHNVVIQNQKNKIFTKEGMKNALNLSLAKPSLANQVAARPMPPTPTTSAQKTPSTTSAQNLIRSPSFTTTTTSSTRKPSLPPRFSIQNTVPSNRPIQKPAVPRNSNPTSLVATASAAQGGPKVFNRFNPHGEALHNTTGTSNLKKPGGLPSNITVKKLNVNALPQSANRIPSKSSTFAPHNRTSGSLQVPVKPQTSQVNVVVQKPVHKKPPPVSVTPIRTQSTKAGTSSNMTQNIRNPIQSVQNNNQMQIIKLNPQAKTIARPSQSQSLRAGTQTSVARSPLNSQTFSPTQNRIQPPTSKTGPLGTIPSVPQKRPYEPPSTLNVLTPKRVRLDPQSQTMKVTPRDQRIQRDTPSIIEDIVEIE